MIIKRVYALILALFIILSPLSIGLNLNAEASSLIPYYPELDIGDIIENGSGWYTLGIGDFLSHVLDSAVVGVQKNLGYVWNRIVDSGYCPGNLENHRHNFIYGLTSTSISLDFTKPQNGYYCYCEYCGQMAGDLIHQYCEQANIDDNGIVHLEANQFILGYGPINGVEWNGEQIVGINENFEYEPYGSAKVIGTYGIDNTGYHLRLNISGFSSNCFYLGTLFDVEYLGVNIDTFINVYSNIYKVIYDNSLYVSSWEIPRLVQRDYEYYYDGKYIIVLHKPYNNINPNVSNNVYFNEPVSYTNILLDKEELNTNFNFDNIEAPITYIDNGVYRYYGLSSDIVDSFNNKYYNPKLGSEFDFSSSTYDYSSNTYELIVPDFDGDGTNENSLVEIEYNDQYLRITDPSGNYIFKYLTNTQTPIYNGNENVNNGININGNINIDVNQRPSNTDAYITTPEDIPNGIVNLREKLATMFSALPNMFGDFAVFMTTGFSYIPEEIRTLLLFGVTTSVFVGLFKMFWR